jgi:hypothetical protein
MDRVEAAGGAAKEAPACRLALNEHPCRASTLFMQYRYQSFRRIEVFRGVNNDGTSTPVLDIVVALD